MTAADDALWRRWDEVDALLDEALDRPAGERSAHVARRAGDDAELAGLVQRLLDRLNDGAGRLSGPSADLVSDAFGSAGGAVAGEGGLSPGDTVGRYVIERRRARGGMATVYEARRADGTYDQRVALKVLRRGLDTDDLIRRFVAERQILSSLAHPNIARLLDGGSLADGRPYLVMEFVDGEPITAHADAGRLDVRARLDLFLEAAGAVHAAHRQLVVHRDIKPSNVLVDSDGRVKLLDFGIAKLLAADGGHTEAGRRALTPDYASPEQLRGDPVTTSTDVYQLGLLLRELLTGLPPLAGDTEPGEPPVRPSRAAMLDLEGSPAPAERAAARRASPPALAGALEGDLDLIAGKALRPEPEERYASADELAADVRRHLRGLPIHAHPESAAYRLRKFAGRHPLFVPGAALAAFAIAGFIAVLSFQNRRITRERDAAQLSEQRALATQEFLVELLRSPDPTAQGANRDITVVEALQRGRARVDSELVDQPAVRAAVLEAMGRTFTGLGRYEIADTLLRRSLNLHRELYGPSALEVARLLGAVGFNLRSQRDFVAADSILHEELAVRVAAGPIADTVLAGYLGGLAINRRDIGDIDSAVVLTARAVALRRRAGDTVGERYTSTLGSLAYVLRGAGRLDSAVAIYREVLRRQLAAPDASPNDLALAHNNLAFALRLQEDYAGAEASYREAWRLLGETLGDGHPTTLMVASNLASTLELAGKLDDVEAIGQARIDAAERQWPEGHWRVGTMHTELGRFLLRHDRFTEAIPALQAGVASFVAALGPGHTWTAVAFANQGAAMLLAGREREGRDALRRAHTVLRDHPIKVDDDGRLALERMAVVLERKGHAAEATPWRELLEAQRQRPPD